MNKAPERIWAWVDYDGNWDGTWLANSETLQPERLPDAEYIRADLHAELVKAADELARLMKGEADCYAEFDNGRIEIKKALTAYQQAKEKMDA